MRFDVLTIFPDMVLHCLGESIIGRAIEQEYISLNVVNIRDFTQDKHGKVDDYTYGGGAGMLMQAQPVFDAWKSVVADAAGETLPDKRIRTVYVTPKGAPFTQKLAADFAKEDEIIFLCGHYEGIDDRVLQEIVTDQVSIGDYVLTGGELPAMVMIDAISRLVPGVLHNDESAETESFYRNLLEYPQYSRPQVWHGREVPEVLLSGDHRRISQWRLQKSIELTRKRRPDLFENYERQERVIQRLSGDKRLNIHAIESLRRGMGEVIYDSENLSAVYDAREETVLLSLYPAKVQNDSFAQDALKILELFKAEAEGIKKIILNSEKWIPFFEEKLRFGCVSEQTQWCYTQKTPLAVRHKNIKPVSESSYGVFTDDEKLAGVCGILPDGSIGGLLVEEAYRRRGFGASLEAFCINRQLEAGMTPFCRTRAGQLEASAMQEKLGLYQAKGSLFYLEMGKENDGQDLELV